jgi:hypothetical protein
MRDGLRERTRDILKRSDEAIRRTDKRLRSCREFLDKLGVELGDRSSKREDYVPEWAEPLD